MSVDEIAIYVFSYNRPVFLQNCVDSIFSCFPGGSVTIVDDDSTDPAVGRYIASLAKGVRTIPASSAGSEVKTGGLYANMNAALADARERGFPYVFFIEDDMQFVRPVTASDLSNFDRYFAQNDRAVEIDLCFRKRQFVNQDVLFSRVDTSGTAYIRDERHPGVIGITDNGLYHLDRLIQLYGEFEIGEVQNQKKAALKKVRVGIFVSPARMWLPFPESYRRMSKSLYLRLIEWVGQVGFHPYVRMSEAAVAALLARDTTKMPVGEDWLDCPTAPRTPRWSYTGGLDNVRARGGPYWLVAVALGKLERWRRQ